MTTRRFRVCLVICLALPGGCTGRTGGKGEEAQRQFSVALAAIRDGSLSRAYVSLMPASYDRDLNVLLTEARQAVTEEEFGLLRDIAVRGSARLGAQLAAFSSAVPAHAAPILTELSKAAASLPRALGLESYGGFRALDARGLLRGLETELLAGVAGLDAYRQSVASVDVRLVAEKGDWAKLLFVASRPDATVNEDAVDVVLVDGKWVPAGWVAEWQPQMEFLRSQIALLVEMKRQDPDFLKHKLRELGAAVEDPGPLLEAVMKQLGFGPTAASEGKGSPGN